MIAAGSNVLSVVDTSVKIKSVLALFSVPGKLCRLIVPQIKSRMQEIWYSARSCVTKGQMFLG